MRVFLSAVTAALAVSVLSPIEAGAATGDAAAVAEDADWILDAQLPSGAIAHHVDRVMVWPYLANYAAMGLARATGVTGNQAYSRGAWRWLAWYQDHQDNRGFVTDYRVASDGSVVSTGDMDSTDAYAGTYLLAVLRTYRAHPDGARLALLHAGITGAVNAIEATQDDDGLTWAKPSWRVKYLMDQAETYAGLRAAAVLAGILDDAALQERAASDARRLADGIDRLWNPTTGAYDWAVHDNGVRHPTDWSIFYPDGQQQMWAVAFGLATGARAADLVVRFNNAQPFWDQPTATATYHFGPAPVGYWPVTGWAFAQVGRTWRSARAAVKIRAAALAADRAWPFTPGNSGQLIQLRSSDPRILAD